MKLKRGDLVRIKCKGYKYFDQEAVILYSVSLEDAYLVILVKDPLTSIEPLRGEELEFISEGHHHIIEQRKAEIERLKTLANEN